MNTLSSTESNCKKPAAPSVPWVLPVSILVYFLLGLLLLPYFLYRIVGDTSAYINIARHYVNDSIWTAINAHWPPFHSWLLIPWVSASVDPLLAGKVVCLVEGSALFYLTWKLGEIIQLSHAFRRLALVVMIPVTLNWTLAFVAGPDVLFAVVFLAYTCLLLDAKFVQNWKKALWAALLAGVGFHVKSFGLPFFVVSFFALSAWSAWNSKVPWSKLLKHLAVGYVVFGLMVAPWITLISIKHGKPTIGTAGAYNFSLISPQTRSYIKGYELAHPTLDRGMTYPPYYGATHISEDTSYFPIEKWSPFSSHANLIFYLKRIAWNIRDAVIVLEKFSPLTALIAVWATAIFIFGFRKGSWMNNPRVKLLVLITIYTSGFLLIFVEDRYIWFVKLPLLLLELYFIQHYCAQKQFRMPIVAMLAALVTLPAAAQSLRALYLVKNADKSLYEIAQQLPDMKGMQVASNESLATCRDLLICYHKRAVYHGAPLEEETIESVARQLEWHGIEYFFQTGTNPPMAYLANFKPEKVFSNSEFQLFRLHPPARPAPAAPDERTW